jgi:uncharacterized protein YdhG (YjbR/CyaY superfamily)
LRATPLRARRLLKQIRTIARRQAPGATELISYGIPTLKVGGHPFVYYAAFKDHVSLYPMTAVIRRQFSAELTHYKTSTGTVQFSLDAPLPVAFVRRLVKARLAEMRKKTG